MQYTSRRYYKEDFRLWLDIVYTFKAVNLKMDILEEGMPVFGE